MSSTSGHWLLTLLLLAPSKEKLSFLVTMVMSAGQGYEEAWSPQDEADPSGPPKLFAGIPSWHPGAGVTGDVQEGKQVVTVSFPSPFCVF